MSQECSIGALSTALIAPMITFVGIMVSYSVYKFSKWKEKATSTFRFLDEWRSREFRLCIEYLRRDFAQRSHTMIDSGVRGLDRVAIKRFTRVSHFFDYLGHAMTVGMINEQLLLTTIGSAGLDLWSIMSPYVRAERRLRERDRLSDPQRVRKGWVKGNEPRYQAGFEHFAEKARRFAESRLLRSLVFMDGSPKQRSNKLR